jgi:hypothetical protein
VNSPGTGRTARRPDVTNVPESHDYVVALALLRRMVAAGALWRHGDVLVDPHDDDAVLDLTPDEQYLLRRLEEQTDMSKKIDDVLKPRVEELTRLIWGGTAGDRTVRRER